MKAVTGGRLKHKCKTCGNKYDLLKVLSIADRQQTLTLICPKCKNRIGESQS